MKMLVTHFKSWGNGDHDVMCTTYHNYWNNIVSVVFPTLLLLFRWLIFLKLLPCSQYSSLTTTICNTVPPQLNSDRFTQNMTSLLSLIILSKWRLKTLFLNDLITEKLLTRAGFVLTPSCRNTELSCHWERCAHLIQLKCTRYYMVGIPKLWRWAKVRGGPEGVQRSTFFATGPR